MKKYFVIMLVALSLLLVSAQIAFADELEDPVPPATDVTHEAGWNEDGTMYYDETGTPVTGVYFIEEEAYMFSEEGVLMKDCYGIYEGKMYYFNGDNGKGSITEPGVKNTLHKMPDGHTYYIDSEGLIYMTAKSGVRKMDNGKRYYFYKGGKVYRTSQKGIKKIGTRAYYFNSDSSVKSNGTTHFMKLNGKTYRVSKYGYLITGWATVNGSRYYMSKKTYARIQDRRYTIEKNVYWFDKSGKMKKSVWRYSSSGKKLNYFASNGKMVKGTSKYVGKYKYYFNSKGTLQTNLIKYKGYNWVYNHAIQISVNRMRNTITLYAKDGNRGYTIPVIAFACTVGSYDRQTNKGVFQTGQVYRWKQLGGRTPYQDNGEEVYGQFVTHFKGAMYFHSVCYWVNGNNHTLITSAYNNLGNAGSHGCVRLRCGDAQIIYNIAARRSCRVVVYDSKYAGPFGKPVYKKISTNYDPTDPAIR